MSEYVPKPMDTSQVALPEELHQLLEQFAKNTHEVWAAQRIQAGWRFGEKRNDEAKEHPCLVPYEDLPESEKQYDRATAAETLRAVITLGYKIEKN